MDTFENNEMHQAPIPPQEPPIPPQEPPQTSYTYQSAAAGRKESPYADSPYMTGTPRQESPYQHPPQKPPKPRSGRGFVRGLLSLLLVCALVAGGCFITIRQNNLAWGQRLSSMEHQYRSELNDLQAQLDALKPEVSLPSGTAAQEGMTPGQLYQSCADSVVAISTTVEATGFYGPASGTASGSGFILSEDGYVVTNYHVVENATEIQVTLHDGQEFAAQLVGKDSSNDIAVLKMDAQDLPAAQIGSSEALVIGDMVAAIGNPLGELSATQTVGYISGINREVTTDNTIINMIQTDAAINPGNSGGPLFNMRGEVIGITTAKYSGTTDSGASIEGIGFAIPIDDVKGIIADLVDFGYVTGAYLGVTVENMDAAAASKYSLPIGAYVRSVEPGMAADRAGIQPKDIIVELGGKTVSSITDLTRALRNYKAGDTTTVTLVRGGSQMTLEVTLDEKPQETTQEPSTPVLPDSEDILGDAFRKFFGN